MYYVAPEVINIIDIIAVSFFFYTAYYKQLSLYTVFNKQRKPHKTAQISRYWNRDTKHNVNNYGCNVHTYTFIYRINITCISEP